MEKKKLHSGSKKSQVDWFLVILLTYCFASFFHFVHNGVLINEYPNLPGWISATGVYITWLAITGIGFVGYLMIYYGKQFLGLVTIAIYGAFGLDGLGHYSLAPMSAHTFTMNLTIWLEATSAMIVLIAVSFLMVIYFKNWSRTIFD